MGEYVRVVTFEADDEAIDTLVARIAADDGPPEGVDAKRIRVLADRAAGKILVAVTFGSDEDLKKASEVFEQMSPPESSNIRRVAVDAYEVLLDRENPSGG
jgi:hypothetical protein